MERASDHPRPFVRTADDRVRRGARRLRNAAIVVAAALVLYAVWRGYQRPDLILDLAVTLGLC